MDALGLKDGAIKCIQKKFCVYTFFGMYNLSKGINGGSLENCKMDFQLALYFRHNLNHEIFFKGYPNMQNKMRIN